MAAPIAHIFLALQVLAGPLVHSEFNEKEFLIGTSFPDIRYLKVVERAETHFDNVSLTDVRNEKNSFKAGMLFHSLVDKVREDFVIQNDFYKYVSDFKFKTQALKFAEDEILEEIINTKKYKFYFDKILNEEKKFNISEENIEMWHCFLKEYFDGNLKSKDLMMKYFDMSEPHAWFIKKWFFSIFYSRKITEGIFNIVSNDEIKNKILKFYLNFTALL